MTDEVAAHLIDLELRLQDAPVRKDAHAVATLLCEEFREFGASGRVWNRAEIIAELAREAPHRIVSKGFACQHLSSELALLTYVAHSLERSTLRSSLWRLEEQGWRMLFHQGTVMSCT